MEGRPMATEREALRDWHRLFGLLLTDFFTDSPFTVEFERDLSVQQQLLDILIVRRRRGRFSGRLPDGLEGLVEHNLISFKSHREALDDWALKELLGLYVAYRKLVSVSPSELLPEDQFRLYAVSARFPHNLSGQVPWQQRQAGVYDCRWGTDTVCVVVAGELPREAHNAPLHLFSASPELVGFGRSAYRQRSENTSMLLGQLFNRLRGEGFAVAYTMEDFRRQYAREGFKKLTLEERREALGSLAPEERRQLLELVEPEERRQMLQSLPVEELLTLLSVEQIQQLRDQLTAGRPAQRRRPRRQR
jgi:hypothetical protein